MVNYAEIVKSIGDHVRDTDADVFSKSRDQLPTYSFDIVVPNHKGDTPSRYSIKLSTTRTSFRMHVTSITDVPDKSDELDAPDESNKSDVKEKRVAILDAYSTGDSTDIFNHVDFNEDETLCNVDPENSLKSMYDTVTKKIDKRWYEDFDKTRNRNYDTFKNGMDAFGKALGSESDASV